MAVEIIEELRQPNLKLQFDIFHRQSLHGDVYDGLERLLPVIGHIQVASVPDRHELDSGELADSRLFDFIDAIGFEGLVGAEYHPRHDTICGLSWFAPYRRR
jgi:hydroxypyruvate isomerase